MPSQSPFSSNKFHDDTYKLLQKGESFDSFSMPKKKDEKESMEWGQKDKKSSSLSLPKISKRSRYSKKQRILFSGFLSMLFISTILLLFPRIKQFYFHNFASPHTYLIYVEEKNISESKRFDSIAALLPSHNSYDFTVNADFSFLPVEMIQERLSPFTISGNCHNIKEENIIQQTLSFHKDEKDPLRFLLTEDTDLSTITLSIPKLSNHSLRLDYSSGICNFISSLNSLLLTEEDISYIKSTIKDYTNLFITDLNNEITVKRNNSIPFTVASHTVDCTQLKITITNKEFRQIASSYAEKMLNDTTLQEFLDRHHYIKKQEFLLSLNDFLTSLMLDESTDLSDDFLVVSIFIDENDHIIGREFAFRDHTIKYGCITKGSISDYTLCVTGFKNNVLINFSRSTLGENWDGNLFISSDDIALPTSITFTDMSKTNNNHITGSILISLDNLYNPTFLVECTEEKMNQVYKIQAFASMLPLFDATITARQDTSLKLEQPNMNAVYSYEDRQSFFDEVSLPLSNHPSTKNLYKLFSAFN